ncbi:ATP-binding protein [Leptolyngbya sp. 7M]|uniref:ATP-binding protein n=1 Tax=Leptolyngbya sp. 7M TaxID=2812896 RepID=UPI001B8AF0F1|nr:ATP-binding protein [Leptolyngbya sp. 7M]QYO68125.1 ATP-binding protein [Leptolyngbya sp. 7M]
MSQVALFPKHKIVGVFRGFSEGGLEFHADLVLPYKSEFQSIPMHGQFLLVQLETENEAVLGRITSLSSAGKLASGVGEEFNIRALQEDRPVPEDLREKYLKYQIDIRVLGILRLSANKISFIPSHRRLPHVGSPVAFLDDAVLREIVGHNDSGSPIGHYALGEFIYCGNSKAAQIEAAMQVKSPEVQVKFPIRNLVSRRSFIFARAGFGKSNLNKLLFSALYEVTPTVEKRKKREVPVGTILFDPDGEYFWPDDKGRPGLCDVPHLQDKLVVFTNRKGPSEFYNCFVAGGIKLDIRTLRPADVISLSVSPEQQNQQNIAKLKGLKPNEWIQLVDLIDRDGNGADLDKIKGLLKLEKLQDAEALAARSNMTKIVRGLHSKESRLMDMLLYALEQGKLCIIDISQMRGQQGLILSGIILRKIFDHNQEQFTEAEPKTIPVLAVIEEAQSVLNERAAGAEPYIEWVKEGRKYDLGSVLITQQPGSIPNEILSQGDNWFVFHLLSAADLRNIKNANSHFSDDILSGLLNEPIPGQGIFWSSSSGKPYPVGVRVLSFEKIYEMLDHEYSRPRVQTFAEILREQYLPVHPTTGEVDQLVILRCAIIKQLREDESFMSKMRDPNIGVKGGELSEKIRNALPDNTFEVEQVARDLFKPVLNELFGEDGWEWFPDRSKRIRCKS